jgi:hypothetical protein
MHFQRQGKQTHFFNNEVTLALPKLGKLKPQLILPYNQSKTK